MASAAIDLVLGRVVSALESEASLLGGVGDEINAIKEELMTMQSFLIDAEKKKNGLTEGEKGWVEQVRSIAYQVEEIVDEFTYLVNSQQVGGRLSKFLPKNISGRHEIGTKLESINKRIRAICERNMRYGVEKVEGSSSSSQRDGNWLRNLGESAFFSSEDGLVGIERETEMLTGWLIDGDPDLSVFSLVGMGGSGKTTLAAKTCSSDAVKRCFGCYAWITVSKTYAVDGLLKRLIKELHGAAKERAPQDLDGAMDYKDLLSVLVGFLKTRKYLVVLDDVWDEKLLMEMRAVFQDYHLGSRIIITTRNKDVASFSFGVPSRSHRVQPLLEAESWLLFSTKAFLGKPCPPEIEPVARELVKRCEGLPIAIVALGGLMASKTSAEDWSRVLDNLSWHMTNIPMLEVVTKTILHLSFNDLPYRLKHCFLYCSIFPEDYSIEVERLTRLWLAEGFVEHVNKVRAEDVADHYLSQLISRSMLQVDLNRAGRPRACKMHDLMRELALSTSERENFFIAYDGKGTIENHDKKTRRLSVQAIDNNLKSYEGAPQLRSLIIFAKDSTSIPLPEKKKLKLLRVLDLEDMAIVNVPGELPQLFNLRYLNLKGTRIKELPKSIGNLLNLETLDITNTLIEKLPSGIAKCEKLRYLVMYRFTGKYGDFKYITGTRAPLEICGLKKLEILSCIESEGGIVKQISNMTQLRRIGITNVKEEDEKDLCDSLQKLKLLQLLDLRVAEADQFLALQAMSSPPPQLKSLILSGKMASVPRWLPNLKNLTYLFLHWSQLTDDPLPHIGALPCLTELRLINAYVGGSLCFATGFVKLECMYLRSLPQTTDIVIEKGVMPDLRVLKMVDFGKLKTPPRGIEHLSKLEELELLRVDKELVDRIQGEGAVDLPRLRHIPTVNYSYQTRNGLRYGSLS